MAAGSFYKSAAWQAVRARVLRRNPVCQVPGCGGLAKDVDHRVSMRKGGPALDETNLVALCGGCHARKTANVDGGFGNQFKPQWQLRAIGCNAAGEPRDPQHHWRRPVRRTAVSRH